MARKTFIQRFRESRSLFQEAISSFLRGDDYGIDYFGSNTRSGEFVTERSALKSTAVQRAVSVIADTIAGLPIHTYKRLVKGKERAIDNPVYRLLHDKPNPYMIPFIFKQTMQYHLLLWGNCYSEIEFNSKGVPINLWPIMPDRVEHKRTQDLKPFFEIRLPDGTSQKLPPYKVFHIPGLGYDGTKGYPPLYMARETIGLSVALQDFGSIFFSNGANIGGVLEHPGKLNDVAKANLKKSINEEYSGLSNAHRLMLLEEGMKYSTTSMPLKDAQFIEGRKFQITEIARIFNIPPHILYDLEHATFTNIEHQGIEFVVYTLRSWLVRWEETINWKLLYNDPKYFVEFLVDTLLRGDTKTRFEAYAIARMWGWMSADDVREKENMNPIPDNGGSIYLSPLNMINASDLVNQAQKVIGAKPNPSIPGDVTQDSLISTYKELASKKSESQKQKVAEQYKGLFVDMSIRIIKRERIYIIREAKKYFPENPQLFNDFLDKFFKEHIVYVSKQLKPVVSSYSQAISELIKNEINFDDDINSNIDKFVDSYSKNEASAYSDERKNEILSLVSGKFKDNEELIEAFNDSFTGWEDEKPYYIADYQTSKIINEVQALVYGLAGKE